VLIVHRYGRMEPGDDIVLVICCSEHRDNAFDACRFLMDFLKTRAPFWKLEEGRDQVNWVDARESDNAAAARWIKE
jgi:molybdopterin synthase catalytic subunit